MYLNSLLCFRIFIASREIAAFDVERLMEKYNDKTVLSTSSRIINQLTAEIQALNYIIS